MSTEKLLVGIRDVPEDFPKREAQYRARVVPERQLAVDPFAPALSVDECQETARCRRTQPRRALSKGVHSQQMPELPVHSAAASFSWVNFLFLFVESVLD